MSGRLGASSCADILLCMQASPSFALSLLCMRQFQAVWVASWAYLFASIDITNPSRSHICVGRIGKMIRPNPARGFWLSVTAHIFLSAWLFWSAKLFNFLKFALTTYKSNFACAKKWMPILLYRSIWGEQGRQANSGLVNSCKVRSCYFFAGPGHDCFKVVRCRWHFLWWIQLKNG